MKKQIDNSYNLYQHIWNYKQSNKYISYKTASSKKQQNKGSKIISYLFFVNSSKNAATL
ncbi:13986_t:CDS:2 [Cetraspora pellucida]|uniref:13986_t:CDS:1 n=1 Tax=Cetraspora pellucida TaxID=1433469 RepID=A0A9N9HW03_9GLOM|nr:13986_t:CDS:2 [Cetraspora pellucida]